MRIFTTIIVAIVSALCVSAETFVVCVGIGNYADGRIQKLTKAENDAKAISEFFKRGTDNVITITGKYATKARILRCLRSQFARARKGDKIIFYYGGHGYPGGFCPYDMTKIENGLTYDEVIRIMRHSSASDKFIFADACNSGAIRRANNGPSKTNAGNIVFFLSSRANESSIESPYLANGYFTKHLLRGLRGGADVNRDRKITAYELFKYVSDGVQSQSHGKQHPVMWGKFPDNLVIVSYAKK